MNSDFCNSYRAGDIYIIYNNDVVFTGTITDCDNEQNTVDIQINDTEKPIIDYNGDTVGIGGTGTFSQKKWKFQKIEPHHLTISRNTRRGGKSNKKRVKRNKKSRRTKGTRR